MRSDRFSGLMLLALALYVAWANRAYPAGTLHEPGPGYMPLLLAVFLGAMGVLIAIRGGSSMPLARIGWGESRRAVVILVAAGVAAFALEQIGYRLTVIALLVFFMGAVERKPPFVVATVAVVFAFASHYVVADLLLVPLPRSPWGL